MTKRKCLEDAYRVFAYEECDMDKEAALAKINHARSAPSKNKRLRRIHEAHKRVMLKEAELKGAVVAADLVRKVKLRTASNIVE